MAAYADMCRRQYDKGYRLQTGGGKREGDSLRRHSVRQVCFFGDKGGVSMKRLSALLGAMDMTMGKPSSNLIRFSIPLLIGNFAQQLYNTVDSIGVG